MSCLSQNSNKEVIAVIDVSCVGILVADVIAKPVSKVPEKGLLSLVDSIELFTGGNAMTASINISKLGLKSAIVGKVGEDYFGEFLKNVLLSKGVNCEALSTDKNNQTSASVALSDADGERTFLHCTGSNSSFSIRDVNWDVIDDSKAVFVTGSFLMNTFDGEETMEFLKKCKEKGKLTALDVCWDSLGRWGSLLNMAMPYIDIFMPSIDEARMLSEATEYEDICLDFMNKGVGSVVLKVGKDGCYIKQTKEEKGILIPSLKGIDVVDTTGAGDSFCSGFLTAYLKTNDFLFSAKFANAVGAESVMKKGATTGILSYDETIEFMKKKQVY